MKAILLVRANEYVRQFLACTLMSVLGLNASGVWAGSAQQCAVEGAANLWARDNLHAWEIANFDLMKRSPEERARMLRKAGIRHYAYLSGADPYVLKPDVSMSHLDVDAEIEAMQRYGIDVRAWYFWINTDRPLDDDNLKKTLESFERHSIQPQIWVPQSYANPFPESKDGFPRTEEEQKQRVRQEAERIAAIVKLAAPYGCKVNLYNHRGWFGIIENQLAILDRLREIGVTDVGMVYNFSHSSSDVHDDSKVFTQLWPRIKPHVVAINVYVRPQTLEMMRTIQDSAWTGPVGVLVAGYGNAELTLENALWNLEWGVGELGKH